jgi:hexokinase
VSVAPTGLDAAMERVTSALTVRAEALQQLVTDFGAEMTRGLAGAPSSLRMLPTFAEQPRGDERGRIVVVDWGGTHGRAAVVELGPGGACRLAADEVLLSFTDAEKTGPAEHVFDVVAAAVARALEGAPPGSYPLGFAYSFPAWLERIDRAIALSLTKGWNPIGLEGQDVVALLQAALHRRGLDRVTVGAVANDTVGALVLETYRARGREPGARPVEIGLILGTGTNQAADLPGLGIRNLESGNFDAVGGLETVWDRALDRELTDPRPGAQRFEKLVSGQYLGEILRRIIVDVAGVTTLFRWPTASFRTPFGFDSAHLSRLAADRTDELAETDVLLRGLAVKSTAEERRTLQQIGALIGRRAARLVGAALVGTLRFIDPSLATPHTIAVDGSLYGGYPGFDAMVTDTFLELLGPERAGRLRIVFSKDSTAAGVAVVAAVAARRG